MRQEVDVQEYKKIFEGIGATHFPLKLSESALVETFTKELDENEAFNVVDLSWVARQYKLWKSLLPRVKPFYAVKCNPNKTICKVLEKLGAGFDCASKEEIRIAKRLGVDPAKRIIFANPCKQISHIQYARKNNVQMVTVDNEEELRKLAKHWPEAKILVRIITDDSKSICQFSSKYGAHMDTCPKLIALAKQLNLNLVGVSFHVGSGCGDASAFVKAVKAAREVFNMGSKQGYKFNILDLGGGFPGTESVSPSFTEIANAIRDLINELFPEEVSVIAEPGRYFACGSQILACNVFAKRVQTDGDFKKILYYINDGVYGSFNCIFFDHVKDIGLIPLKKKEDSKLVKSTVFGPTCDSLDKIVDNVMMPELEVGEWVYVRQFGAYTTSASSSFNGFKTTKTHYIWRN
jgi:ornithine decarboxylase